MKLKGARLLNEKSGWLGLSVFDLGALGYLLIFSHAILEKFGLELLSFVFTGIVSFFVLTLRLKYRRKTIRDFIKAKLGPKIIG